MYGAVVAALCQLQKRAAGLFQPAAFFFSPLLTSDSHHECRTCFAADGGKEKRPPLGLVIFHCNEGEDLAAVTRPVAPQRSSGDGSFQKVFCTGWRVRGC